MSASNTSGATILTLPTETTPAYQQAVGTRASSGVVSLIVTTARTVSVSSNLASGATVDLDSLTFVI